MLHSVTFPVKAGDQQTTLVAFPDFVLLVEFRDVLRRFPQNPMEFYTALNLISIFYTFHSELMIEKPKKCQRNFKVHTEWSKSTFSFAKWYKNVFVKFVHCTLNKFMCAWGKLKRLCVLVVVIFSLFLPFQAILGKNTPFQK